MKKIISVLLALSLMGGASAAAADGGVSVSLDMEDGRLILSFDTGELPAGEEEARNSADEWEYGIRGAVDENSAEAAGVTLSGGEKILDGVCLVVWEGTAVQNSGSSVLVARNSYIRGDTAMETGPLEGNPGNLLVAGNIRTTLALGRGQSFYINSTIISRNWAALSTDGAEPALAADEKELSLYAYGTEAVTQDGGYGAYSDLFCNLFLFGSHIRAAEIGIISGTYGAVEIGTIADGEANAEMSARLTAEDCGLRADKLTGSLVVGGRNAVMLHSVNLPPYWAYDGYSQTEIPLHSTAFSAHGSVLRTDLSLDGGVIYAGDKQGYIRHTAGSVILIKSTNADMLFDGCSLEADPAGTGCILQTVFNNDTMFMNAVPDGECYPGINVELRNMSACGDVAHEDYQRSLTLTLRAAVLTGAANEFGCAHWNACGAAEGFSEYCLDEAYETHHGLHMVLADGAEWNVTGESSLSSLDIGEGCVVNGAIIVDGVAADGSAGFYEGVIVVRPAQ